MKYTIGQLHGYEWERAIINVGAILGQDEKSSLNGWYRICGICRKLGVRFDENGNVIAE